MQAWLKITVGYLLVVLLTTACSTDAPQGVVSGSIVIADGTDPLLTVPDGDSPQYWLAELQIPPAVIVKATLQQNGSQRLLASHASGRTALRFISDGRSQIALQLVYARKRNAALIDWSFTPLSSLPQPPAEEVSPETIKSPQLRQILSSGSKLSKSPLVEQLPGMPASERLLTFVYQGARHNVQLLGAPVSDIVSLQKIADSDIWFRSFTVPADTLLSYRMAADVPQLNADKRQQRMAILSRLQPDPLNPVRWPDTGTVIQESVVDLKHQVVLPSGSMDTGRISYHWYPSRILNNERMLALYRPAATTDTSHARLLILFDGMEYQHTVFAPERVDQLHENGLIAPLFLLMVSNPDGESRSKELTANPQFADFIADELLPWAEQTLARTFNRDQVIVAGSSYGGLAALSAALSRPERMGHVLSMSGSFWWQDKLGNMQQRLQQATALPLSVYLSAGLFEGGQQDAGILETNQAVADILANKNIRHHLSLLPAGHDYFAWSYAFEDGLMYLHPAP